MMRRLCAIAVRAAVVAHCAVLAGLCGMASAQAQPETQAAPPSTMLIFDGSGSMWAKLDGAKQTKLVDAREAVKASLAKQSPQSTHFGLVSYGHRRPSDCTDVQIIAAPDATPAPAFVERITGPLDKLNPKGKGPLTAALKEAAKMLGKANVPRSIVLIHDDLDNCQQDACAALSELQQSAPGVIVHVVGLGLKPDEAGRYQCLTKPTGGLLVNAQDAAQIAAGIADVIQLAAFGGRDTDPPVVKAAAVQTPPVQQPAPPPPPKPDVIELAKDGPPALRLRAFTTKDRLVVGHRVRWSILPETRRDTETAIATAEGPDAVLPLAAGTYRVRAEAGLMRAEARATVAAQGQTLSELNFEAGEIRLRTPLAADATVIVTERSAQPATGPAAKPDGARSLGIWPHGQQALLVPPGPLTLRIEQGELRTERPVEVSAGQIRDVDLAQPGGRVTLDLAPPAGPPMAAGAGPFANQAVVFTIEEDDPDAPRGRREIARSASPAAEFVLAPGTYLVAATRGTLEARERITVAAGDAIRRSLPLIAARMVISARLGNTQPRAPGDAPADRFRLSRLDGATDAQGEAVVIMQGPVALIDLPPGRYRVEARRNNAAIRAEQEILIRAGEYRAVTLDYQAGELRLEAAVKAGAAREAIDWQVFDDNGQRMWSGQDAASALLLDAGRYIVRIAVSGKRYERPVEIKAGEISTVRFAQE